MTFPVVLPAFTASSPTAPDLMPAVSQQWACSSQCAASAGVSGSGSPSVRAENSGTLLPEAWVATSSAEPFVSCLAVCSPAAWANGTVVLNKSKRER